MIKATVAAGRESANMLKRAERRRLEDYCFLLACSKRREDERAGRCFDMRDDALSGYLAEHLKKQGRYKAVPMWLIMIFVRLVIEKVIERLLIEKERNDAEE